MADIPTPPQPDDLKDAARRLKQRAKLLEAMASASGAADLRKARQGLDRAEPPPVSDLLAATDSFLAHEERTRRGRLAQGLRDRVAAEGTELVVITREPLELRLPPVGVTVDVEADRAELSFGREVLARCPADTDAVLAARRDALAELEGDSFDPAAFHRALRQAWRRADGDGWKELVDVLPQLVLALQSPRFLRDPSARNFRGYSRARFVYDLWRLRRERSLSVDGWRLSLGSATGGSTKDKKRVFWLEDDQGRGQYFLTLRFVPEEDARDV